MNIIEHFKSIRNHIEKGRINEAIDKLQFLSNKSSILDKVILQKSRLSELNKIILNGTLSYEEGNITRNQITSSILNLANEIEKEILKEDGIRKQLFLSVEEFIRKFGLDSKIIKKYLPTSSRKKLICLWVDDKPEDDKIEMDILTALNIQCKIATDPYSAYQIMKEKKPNIIVINSLGRLRDNINEGIEYCEFLNRDKKYKDIPVIMHSISLQNRINNREKVKLPKNIKNNFKDKNTLIIKDLIEEIIINLKR